MSNSGGVVRAVLFSFTTVLSHWVFLVKVFNEAAFPQRTTEISLDIWDGYFIQGGVL